MWRLSAKLAANYVFLSSNMEWAGAPNVLNSGPKESYDVPRLAFWHHKIVDEKNAGPSIITR
jgi:hypothetical protein